MMTYDWIDRAAYPFAPHVLDLPDGKMHYVDEGEGDPILFVHGTPTWSFLYRGLIRALAPQYRCIAPDHLGFGLSEKPEGWSYRPEDHAHNLHTLIDALNLRRLTLVVHDYGGPIGLSYALEHPENIARIVVFNSWLWPFSGDPSAVQAGRLMGGPIGRFLYTRLNFSPRVMLPLAWGKRTRLARHVHEHYTRVHQHPHERQATWALARAILGSEAWFDSLWERRAQIANIPALIIWGMRDPVLKPALLQRWQAVFSTASTRTLNDTGHFVPEEATDEAAQAISAFLAAPRAQPSFGSSLSAAELMQ